MSDGDRPHARHHSNRGPNIGQQMIRIRLKCDRIMLARRPQEQQCHAEIHDRGHHGDRQADADRLQGPGRDQPPHRRHPNAHCRNQDQRAFDSAGEILRLAVTVGVLLVGGPGGHGQHRQGHQAAGKVHQ